MENHRSLKKIQLSPAHLPTLLVVIGYPLFWIEMYFSKSSQGIASSLGWLLFIVVSLGVISQERGKIWAGVRSAKTDFEKLDRFTKYWLMAAMASIVLILMIVFYAYLLPPHLIQETDALNYHITLPRQHLILHSFEHIRWSTADLYLLPVDFALAPFWLATDLPNKFPQFLFLLGLIGVAVNLVDQLSGKNFFSACLVVVAIFASHNVGIQMGTAMLDIVICYLLLAALDSFLKGNALLGAIEFAFYFWSKSFMPIQTVIIIAGVAVLLMILWALKIKGITLGFEVKAEGGLLRGHRNQVRKFLVYFLLLSLVIGGPFVLKSLYYARTPLFPWAVGSIPISFIDKNSLAWRSLEEKAQEVMNTRDQYGSGRSIIEFARHLWLIAVPEKDVNNRYDYPVGLVYLLFVGPFFYLLWESLRRKTFPLLPVFSCVFWLTWWMGSQQTRFLFVPIMLMLIVVASAIKTSSRVLMGAMLMGLMLVTVSVFRAHKMDLGRGSYEVLRDKDRKLLSMVSTAKEIPISLDFPDAAFAKFPVEVKGSNSVFVLQH